MERLLEADVDYHDRDIDDHHDDFEGYHDDDFDDNPVDNDKYNHELGIKVLLNICQKQF